jgi:predicted RNA-binding Zn-ribbon protein involved in translation (DUF1610 family)
MKQNITYEDYFTYFNQAKSLNVAAFRLKEGKHTKIICPSCAPVGQSADAAISGGAIIVDVIFDDDLDYWHDSCADCEVPLHIESEPDFFQCPMCQSLKISAQITGWAATKHRRISSLLDEKAEFSFSKDFQCRCDKCGYKGPEDAFLGKLVPFRVYKRDKGVYKDAGKFIWVSGTTGIPEINAAVQASGIVDWSHLERLSDKTVMLIENHVAAYELRSAAYSKVLMQCETCGHISRKNQWVGDCCPCCGRYVTWHNYTGQQGNLFNPAGRFCARQYVYSTDVDGRLFGYLGHCLSQQFNLPENADTVKVVNELNSAIRNADDVNFPVGGVRIFPGTFHEQHKLVVKSESGKNSLYELEKIGEIE